MIINLKQVNLTDSDNIKLDKINYNFDQLVANGGGPQGPNGSKGDTGAQGVTGVQGYQGVQGVRGFQGEPGDNTTAYWKNIQGVPSNLSADTIIPVHNPVTVPPSPSMAFPPVVSVGFASGDSQYNIAQPVNNAQVPYQWIINRKNHFSSNLRFTSSDVTDNWVDFVMEKESNSKNRFITKFNNPINSSFIWYAQNHIFKSNLSGNALLEITDSVIKYNVDTEFNRPVTVKEQLIIEDPSAGTDKIAVASNNTGKIIFKSIKELGGIVPYGTIISILPSVFNDDTKFIKTQNETLANPDDLIKFKVGSGVGDYDGWYVCNGKTWKGTRDHIVPDLNSFSYTIADNGGSINPNSQGSRTVTNNGVHIIGGADISMAATNSPGVYGISSTIDSSTIDAQTTSGGSTYKIKRLPQVIYLGESNCYWQDGGIGQAPNTDVTFKVQDGASILSPNPSTLGNKTFSQGGSYTETFQLVAPSGYYWSSVPTIGNGGNSYIGTPSVSLNGAGPRHTVIDITVPVTAQPANGTIVTLSANFTGILIAIPVSTVTYPTMISYPTLDDVMNGSLSSGAFDLGTDPNSAGTILTTDLTVTADTGTVRYLKYYIFSDSNYLFENFDLTMITLRNITAGANITEHSVTVNPVIGGDRLDYIVKDNSFGSVNPGGSSTVNFEIKAAATAAPLVFTGGTQVNRTQKWTASGIPIPGKFILLGIYSTTINYEIQHGTIPDMLSAYAAYLNGLPASAWLAAGIYNYTQGNPIGFKPSAFVDTNTMELNLVMNAQNSAGTPYVSSTAYVPYVPPFDQGPEDGVFYCLDQYGNCGLYSQPCSNYLDSYGLPYANC